MRPWYTGREEVKDNHKTIFFFKEKVLLNVKIIKEIEEKDHEPHEFVNRSEASQIKKLQSSFPIKSKAVGWNWRKKPHKNCD